MILFLCLIISFTQLLQILVLIKPLNPYLTILQYFLLYPVLFSQIVPIIIELFSVDLQVENYHLLYAYTLNYIYFMVFIYFFNRLSRGRSFRLSPWDKFKYLLLLANLFNGIFVLYSNRLLDINLKEVTFPFYQALSSFRIIIPLIGIIYYANTSNYICRFYIHISGLLYISSIITSGSRGLLILPIFYLIFYYKIDVKKKIIAFFAFMVIFIPISSYYKNLRYTASLDENISSQTYESINFISEVRFRLGESNKISAGIVEMIRRDGPVGSEPLISSALSIIPSSYFEDGKPWPGSKDGTSFGILARQAHEFVYGAIWNMSEYMYTLHPVWEFGLGYLFLNIFLTILWILTLERIAWGIGDKIGIIIICSFMPFTYSIVIQPIVLILQTMVYITIPSILFIMIYKFSKISLKYIRICIK